MSHYDKIKDKNRDELFDEINTLCELIDSQHNVLYAMHHKKAVLHHFDMLKSIAIGSVIGAMLAKIF